MKIRNLSILACAIGLFFGRSETLAAVTKIYISTTGYDINPGTKELPLASLDGALLKLRSIKKSSTLDGTVEVIVGDGNYFLTKPFILGPDDSGTENSPVIFRAEDGAHPVFSGGKIINGFEKVSESLWRAKISEVVEFGWYFEQLYVNGRRAVRAKSPNKGFYFLKDVSETILEKGNGRFPKLGVQHLMLFKDGASNVSSLLAEDYSDAVITFYHKWDNTRKKIVGYNKDSSIVYTVGQGMKPWNSLDKKTRYILENYKAALDTCGEWYLDRSGYLYYMPLPGETIQNLEVVAPVTDQLVIFKGDEKSGKTVGNIRFEGLSFRYT
ncbi:MAG: hypothetical protein WC699_18750, partial [Bacteroidales bacterium]